MIPSLVLYTSPLVIFSLFSRHRIALALPIAIIAGLLLLPEKTFLDLPLIPRLDKHSLPVFTACLTLLTASRYNTSHPPIKGVLLPNFTGNTILLLLILAPLLTMATNQDPLTYGYRYLPGLSPRDSLAEILASLTKILPFFLAYKFLGHPDNHRPLLWVLICAGLIYSIPTLMEARLAPFLHRMVYGIQTVDWLQHLRGGGFRPIVFLQHGLLLSQFLSFCVLASLGGIRFAAPKYRVYLWATAGFLAVTLIISKSLGPLILTILFGAIILFFSARMQMLFAATLAAMVVIYPILRGADVIPADRILQFAESISPARAESLAFRFRNEDVLLEKARQRPTFGWGGYGRSRVFDSAGNDLSVTDGYWVIVFGNGGWTRYLSVMGLLTAPVILLALRARRYDIGLETSTLTLIFTSNLVDLIPNAGETNLTWLFAGVLWGRFALGKIAVNNDETSPETLAPSQMRYQRGTNTSAFDTKTQTYARPYEKKFRQ